MSVPWTRTKQGVAVGILFTRHTEPDADQQLLLAQLGWTLPAQPSCASLQNEPCKCRPDCWRGAGANFSA